MKNFILSTILVLATSFVLFTPEVNAKEYQKRYHNHKQVKKYKSKSSRSFFNLNLNLGSPGYVEREVVYPYQPQVYYTQPVPYVVERAAPVPIPVYEQRVYYPAYRTYSYWGY